MQKKGFTLVELLAVLIVLAIIGAIATSQVFSSLKSTKIKLCENMINDIEEEAKAWAGENIYLLPTLSLKDQEITANLIKKDENVSWNENNLYIDYQNKKFNLEDIDSDTYNTLVIKLGLLQDNGYIDKEIDNPAPNSLEITPDLEIKIIYKNNNYEYLVINKEEICSGDEK